MKQAVLTIIGKVVPCCTYHPLTDSDIHSLTERNKCKCFTEALTSIFGNSMKLETEISIDSDELENLAIYEVGNLIDDNVPEGLKRQLHLHLSTLKYTCLKGRRYKLGKSLGESKT